MELNLDNFCPTSTVKLVLKAAKPLFSATGQLKKSYLLARQYKFLLSATDDNQPNEEKG